VPKYFTDSGHTTYVQPDSPVGKVDVLDLNEAHLARSKAGVECGEETPIHLATATA
jgi:hypothetical protein